MLKTASNLLFLAPATTFGLGAAFVAASYGLGAAPADPAAWQTYLALAPLIREPVHFISTLPGLGDVAALALFGVLALAGCAIALSPRTGRTHFVYAHLALLIMIYSMSKSGAFTASFPVTEGLGGFGWSLDLSAFPASGVVILAFVALACASTHFQVLRRIRERAATRSDVENELSTSLRQFA